MQNKKQKYFKDLDECAHPISMRCEEYKEICVKKPVRSVCVPHCSGGTKNISGTCEGNN